MSLREIRFLNDFQIYQNADTDLWAAGVGYDPAKPDWKSANNPDRPVGYVRNKKMRLDVRIRVANDALEDATLLVYGPDGLFGQAIFTTPCGVEEKRPVSITMTTALPDAVKIYNPMTLTWKEKAPGSTQEVTIATTQHTVYVTYATPLFALSKPTPKRLGAVCSPAADQNTVDGIATKIYDWLSGPDTTFSYNTAHPIPWNQMNPWALLPGGSRPTGDCRDLANLMMHACGVIGVSASLGYVYATTDAANFSTRDDAEEARVFDLGGGATRAEGLGFVAGGGVNAWEGVCVVNNHYYAIKETHDADPLQVLKTIVCPNTANGNHQCWAYVVDQRLGIMRCNETDGFVVDIPGGCP